MLKLIKKIFLIVFILFIVIFVSTLIALPKIARTILFDNGKKIIGREIVLKDIKINYFKTFIEVNNFKILSSNGKEDFVSFEKFFVDFSLLKLFLKKIDIAKVELINPVFVIEKENNNMNFDDIIKKFENKNKTVSKNKETKNGFFDYNVENIKIKNGVLVYNDKDKKTKIQSSNINISLPKFSSEESNGEMVLKFKLNEGEIVLKSNLDLDKKRVISNLVCKDVKFGSLLPYMQDYFNIKDMKGTLNTDLKLDISFLENLDISIKGNNKINKFKLIDNKNNTVISLEKFDIYLDEINPIKNNFFIEKVNILSPFVLYKKYGETNSLLNLLKDLKKDNKDKHINKKEEKKKVELNLDIKSINISKGKFDYKDIILNEKYEYSFNNINFRLENLSTKDINCNYTFSTNISKEETIYLKGDLKLKDGIYVKSNLQINKFDLKKFDGILKNYLNITSIKGTVNNNFEIILDNEKSLLIKGIAEINNLFIDDINQKPILAFDKLRVAIDEVDIYKNIFNINIVELQKPTFLFQKFKSGDSIKNLIKIDFSSNFEEEKIEKKQKKDLSYKLNVLRINDGTFIFNDKTYKDEVIYKINKIDLEIKDISKENKEFSYLKLSSLLDETGSLTAISKFKLDKGLYLIGDLKINKLYIDNFQPYIKDVLNINEIKGFVSSSLKVKVDFDKDKKIILKGICSLNGFQMKNKSDKEILGWNKLRVDINNMDILENIFILNNLELNNPRINFRQSRNSHNFSDLVKENDKKIEESKKEPIELRYKINKGKIINGKIMYSDLKLAKEINYKINKLNADFENIANDNQEGNILMTAKINETSMLHYESKIKMKYTYDIDSILKIENFNLKDLSPYTIEYLNLPVDNGILSITSQFTLKNNKLDSRNWIKIYGLNFGDKIDKKDSGKTSLKFALSTIKDKDGNIILEIPVNGDINDPKFEIRNVIFTTIKNVVIKSASKLLLFN